MSTHLETDIAAWLAELAPDLDDTLRDRPRSTIVPRPRRESRSERALELLRKLAGVSADGDEPLPELELGDEIARGGMGRIRVASQLALGREVVVKTLREELRADVGATLELLREAWVTGTLEHPNVMPVYDIALDDEGCPLIVLKRIEGVTWSQLMRDPGAVRERFSVEDMLDWNLHILLNVLDALRFAHSRGIIHRDIKPDNVMIGEFGEVYLVDWGIAVSLIEDPSGRLPHATMAKGAIAGTPAYLAPEMLGEELTERTDVYLAGSSLFEIVAGRPPHPGETVLEVLTNVATNEPTLPEDAPAELARVCERALARDPSERFASVDEMRMALQHFISHRGSTKLSDAADIRLAELHAELATALAAGDESVRTRREKREEIHRLLGECRFGYSAALSAWPENTAARTNLHEAVVAVARYELESDNPGTAHTLLSGIDDPPEALSAEVVRAIAERDERRRRFEALSSQDDPRLGNRTRIFLTWILGTLWTALPLIGHFLDRESNMASGEGAYHRMALLTLGLLVFVLGLGVWARESIAKTRMNRLLGVVLVVALGCQLCLVAGGALLEMPPAAVQAIFPLIWAACALVFAMFLDKRTMFIAVGYLAAFFLGAAWPEYRLLFIAGSNAIVLLNLLLIWRTLVGDSPKRGRDSEPPQPQP